MQNRIYIELPIFFNDERINEVNALLSEYSFKAELSDVNNQWAYVEINHPMDARGIVNAMEDFSFEYSIYEGEPKEDLSNQIF